jgi:transposase-like protein
MRDYSREFRMHVVRRILDGEKVPALAQELGIHRKLLYEWTRRVNEGGESNLRERGRPRKIHAIGNSGTSPRQISELERTVARQQFVIEFLTHALQRVRGLAGSEGRGWRDAIFQTIESMMQRQAGLSIETMCEAARVSRGSYYRYLRTRGAEAATP